MTDSGDAPSTPHRLEVSVPEEASTVQQLAVRFGVDLAHRCLAAITIIPALVFIELKLSDGDAVSSHKSEL